MRPPWGRVGRGLRLTPRAGLAAMVLMTGMVAAPVAASEPWQGIWSYDPAWCAVSDRIGSVTPAPVALTETEFLGYENSCEIKAVSDAGYSAWTLRLECQSEGSTYDNVFTVLVGDGRLWLWDGAGEPTPFHRCPE